jgi:flagellar motor switch protein FliN/FliY
VSKKLSQSEIDELVKSLLEGEPQPESPSAAATAPVSTPASTPDSTPVSTPASSPAAPPVSAPVADAVTFDQVVDLGPVTQAEVDALTRGETVAKAAPPPSAAAMSMPPSGAAHAAAEAQQAAKTRQALAMARLYGALLEIELPVSVELGRARLPLGDVLALGPGSVITLETLANSPVDVLVNRVPLMKGEVLAIGEKYGVRIIESNIDTKAAS